MIVGEPSAIRECMVQRKSQPQLKVSAAGKFTLRHFLGNRGFLFSSENDGESPEIPMTDDLPEMLFCE